MSKNRQGGPRGGGARLVATQSTHIQQFGGPLPPADHFSAYDTVLPGAAERILRMAELEQQERLARERALVQAEAEQTKEFLAIQRLQIVEQARTGKRGQLIAGILSGTTCLGGIIVIALGHATGGAVAIVASLAAIASASFVGKRAEPDQTDPPGK